MLINFLIVLFFFYLSSGMAVYNVCTICAIGVPLALVIYTQHHNLYFYVVAISIVSCTTLTLCLVFVPKVSILREAF